jgi:beta-glucan synthesis-associated protein KRE6
MIDPETPDNAKTRQGFDGEHYELVFSDEFNTPGRSFYPGDDPFWEAVDLWYGATADLEWYDPSQITTKNGYLSIVMDQVADPTLNHMQPYKSGMLQSWNKFCFTSGYIEVAVVMPGANEESRGYVCRWTPSEELSTNCDSVAGSLDNGKLGSSWVWSNDGWYMAILVGI